MMNEKRMKYQGDIMLHIGLVLYGIYSLVDRFIVTIPDVWAYPWMTISVICMLIGVFRTGIMLGKNKKVNLFDELQSNDFDCVDS